MKNELLTEKMKEISKIANEVKSPRVHEIYQKDIGGNFPSGQISDLLSLVIYDIMCSMENIFSIFLEESLRYTSINT